MTTALCNACGWNGELSEVRGLTRTPENDAVDPVAGKLEAFEQKPCPKCGGGVQLLAEFKVQRPIVIAAVPAFVPTDECPTCGWVGSWDGAVCPECGKDTRPL